MTLESITLVFGEHSEGTQRIIREQSESIKIKREHSDFVIPSEPRILRLVIKENMALFMIFYKGKHSPIPYS